MTSSTAKRNTGPKAPRSSLAIAICLGMVLGACGAEEPALDGNRTAATARDFEGEQGMQLGAGYQAVVEDVRGKCVDLKPGTPLGSSQEAVFSLQLLESTRDLAASLNISSASQIKATIPDTAVNVSSKSKYVFGSTLSLNKYSVFLLVSTIVKNETINADSATLSAPVAAMLAADPAGALDRFRTQCGDEFLSGYTTGGEFHGVIEIQTDSMEHKTELAQELSTGVGVEGLADGATESRIDATLKRVTRNQRVRIWTFQKGGSAAEATPVSTVEEMLARAKKLPEIVAKPGAGRPLTATFLDYSTLNLPLPASYTKELATAKQAIGALGRRQSELYDLRGNLDYIIANPAAFEGVTETEVAGFRQLRQQVNQRLQAVYTAAQTCFVDLKACATVQPAELPTFNEPRRLDAAMIGNRGLSIAINPQVIRRERIKDYWSQPECYLKVNVVTEDDRRETVIQTQIYDNCDVPAMVLETSTDRVREAFANLGYPPAAGWLEVQIWEADTSYDDFVGNVYARFDRLGRDRRVRTAVSNENVVIDVEFRLSSL